MWWLLLLAASVAARRYQIHINTSDSYTWLKYDDSAIAFTFLSDGLVTYRIASISTPLKNSVFALVPEDDATEGRTLCDGLPEVSLSFPHNLVLAGTLVPPAGRYYFCLVNCARNAIDFDVELGLTNGGSELSGAEGPASGAAALLLALWLVALGGTGLHWAVAARRGQLARVHAPIFAFGACKTAAAAYELAYWAAQARAAAEDSRAEMAYYLFVGLGQAGFFAAVLLLTKGWGFARRTTGSAAHILFGTVCAIFITEALRGLMNSLTLELFCVSIYLVLASASLVVAFKNAFTGARKMRARLQFPSLSRARATGTRLRIFLYLQIFLVGWVLAVLVNFFAVLVAPQWILNVTYSLLDLTSYLALWWIFHPRPGALFFSWHLPPRIRNFIFRRPPPPRHEHHHHNHRHHRRRNGPAPEERGIELEAVIHREDAVAPAEPEPVENEN